MCGIYGFYSNNVKSPEILLKKMGDKLSHRGPDSYGIYGNKNCYFGHRRLSIIDLKTGNQPIYNENRDIVLIFNGEIYNFHDLKRDLQKKGHSFYTNTDTEVIVHLYEEYEEELLEHLNGQFAFALYDKKRDRIFLARDRMGQKPLYYYRDNKIFIFASEIKALLIHNIDKSIDYEGLTFFLKHQFIPGEKTAFVHIKKLPPAHYLIFENGMLEKKRYWNLPLTDEYIPQKRAIDLVDEALNRSVELRKISDVPIGSFLSGGIDSSLITAIYAKKSNAPINTFTIDFEERGYSERELAEITANQYKTNHTNIVVNISNLDNLEHILSFFDEPFGDYSLIPTFYLTKAVSKNIKVAISGDGGDELFGGYARYKNFLKLNVVCHLQWLFHNEKLKRYCFLNWQQRYIRFISIFKDEELQELISNYKGIDYEYFFPEHLDLKYSIMANDLSLYLPEDGLVKVDRMSMANSLEVRNPFLDHKLIESALKISSNYKFDMCQTKKILRKLARRYLSKKVVKGKKRGFNPPLLKWYNEKSYFKKVKQRVLEGELIKTDFLKRQFVENLLKFPIAYSRVHRIFLLDALTIWYERYGK